MLEKVTATRFERVMSSGRTKPCLMTCERETGEEIEAVVKLRGNHEIHPGAFLCEAFSAMFAQDMGLLVPSPLCVTIEDDLARTVPAPELQPVFLKSVGTNFGSTKWSPGYTIWPRDKSAGKKFLLSIMEVFIFDGLIQNPDRRSENPNCAFLGDQLLIFDHEAAFSNFMDILPLNPWDQNGLKFLSTHIFRNVLKGEPLQFDRIEKALTEIDEARLRSYIYSIPDDWGGTVITGEKIVQYLLECKSRVEDIKLQLEAMR